ncbi:MAG: energy transducer TonB [Colwellia sp.]|nr:energy transducer TonB [Colwellia sp.]
MKFSILVFLITLMGCVSNPVKFLSQEPIRIENQDIMKYWKPAKQKISFNNNLATPKEDGFVELRFLIDSNGRIFNPTVVESFPKDVWVPFALQATESRRFIKSDENPKALPVYVTMMYQFNVALYSL